MKKAKFDGGKNGTFAGDDFGSSRRETAAAGGTGIKKPPDKYVWGGFYIIR